MFFFFCKTLSSSPDYFFTLTPPFQHYTLPSFHICILIVFPDLAIFSPYFYIFPRIIFLPPQLQHLFEISNFRSQAMGFFVIVLFIYTVLFLILLDVMPNIMPRFQNVYWITVYPICTSDLICPKFDLLTKPVPCGNSLF